MPSDEFGAAVLRIKSVPSLLPDKLLRLYALYKQATVGDAGGDRPGMMDFKARAKFDAWESVRGMSADDARAAYVDFVNGLVGPA